MVLSNDSVALKHEKSQQIKGLGLQLDDIGTAPQFTTLDVEPVIAKRQNHAVPRRLRTQTLSVSQGWDAKICGESGAADSAVCVGCDLRVRRRLSAASCAR